MFGNKYEDEESYNGIKPNVSHNYDAQLYGTDAYGNVNAHSSYGNANGGILDEYGREVPNRFGLKLVLSILFLFTSFLFGLLAIVFTSGQNRAYKKNDTKTFLKYRKVSNVFLILALICTVFKAAAAVYIVEAYGSYTYEQFEEQVNEFLNELDNSGYYEYDDGDDDYTGYKESDYTVEFAEGTIDIDGMYSVTFFGIGFTVGEKMPELPESLYTDDDLSDLRLEPGEGYDFTLYDDDNNDLWISVYNDSDEDAPVCECEIVRLSNYYIPYTGFSYMNVLSESSTAEEFIQVLGDDFDYYEDSDGWTSYTWHTDDGQISTEFTDTDTGCQTFEIYIGDYFMY